MTPEATETEKPAAGRQAAETDWATALLGNDGRLVHAARLAAIGEIAAGIAHEMNQPLAAIQMIVTSMLADIERGTLPTERARQWLDTVNEQIGRISWIIGHLRSFSRGEGAEPPAAVALGEIVENTLGLLGAQLRSHGIVVELDLEAPLPEVRGSARRLEQVLVNLLSNARDALDTLPNDAPKAVRIRAYAPPGQDPVVIEVADTGPGMSTEVRERLFEPFFTTKGAAQGTGLGLSIVRTIVDECGGHVAVESKPGVGATFRIELPAATPAHAQSGKEPIP